MIASAARTLLDGAFRPGRMHDRMHDQTALQTDGRGLLDRVPDVRCDMDARLLGPRHDHPAQVHVPPAKPAKHAAGRSAWWPRRWLTPDAFLAVPPHGAVRAGLGVLP